MFRNASIGWMKFAVSDTSKKVRLLVVDSVPLFREGLAARINLEPDLACNQHPITLAELRAHVTDAQLLLLEVRNHDGQSVQLIERLRNQYSQLLILAHSQDGSPELVLGSLRAGASGFLLKEEPIEEVLVAIRAVLAGEQYLSRKLAAFFLRNFAEPRKPERVAGDLSSLSARELQVFQLLSSKVGNKQIAAQLNISVKTVEAHRESIKHKLGPWFLAHVGGRGRVDMSNRPPPACY